jgi:hypothetical protein
MRRHTIELNSGFAAPAVNDNVFINGCVKPACIPMRVAHFQKKNT